MNKYVKYPRTYHLPWSEGISNDDKVLQNVDHWNDQIVVVTEKMDGENTTMHNDHIHARSIDSRNHPSRNWVKGFWSSIKHKIPDGWRICGENLYAKHSIHYENLESYFLGFSIFDDRNMCLSWKETLTWFNYFEIEPVRELYRGPFDEEAIKQHWDAVGKEGYVVRTDGEFHYDNFSENVGKYVRKNHVKTDKHWSNMEIVPNKLR